MSSELIKKNLEGLKSQKKLDDGFLDLLIEANELDENGSTTAERVLALIKQQYAKDKENKA